MKKVFISVFLAMLLFGQINAQIVTDRPDQTESSSTVGSGNLQLESGFLIGFEGSGSFSTRQILLPTTLFRYGLTKGIEIRVLSQYETNKIENNTIQGISDIQIGTKIQILKNSKNTEIAFVSHLILPSGTKELTNDKFGTVNKIAFSHRLKENIGLGYNVGYNNFGDGAGDLTYSMSLAIGINDRVNAYIEPYGVFTNLEDFVLNFDSGITYLVNETLQFDFSFGTGINQRMNYLSIGCSWLLKKGKG